MWTSLRTGLKKPDMNDMSGDEEDSWKSTFEKAGYEVFVKPKNIYIPAENPLVARIAFCYGPLGEQIELFCEK